MKNISRYLVMSVMRTIKGYFKQEFLLDLVFIQSGCFYEVYDEDASFLENDPEFKFKPLKRAKICLLQVSMLIMC